MKHFSIVKDGVGGKLVTTYDEARWYEEAYYTNAELKELYHVLGELWINQTE
jgi:hypothetical protein